MIYNNRLKSLREDAKLNQQKLGEVIGVDFKAYSHFEREYTIIPIKHLNTICNFFNVSLDYIFEFSDLKQYNNNRLDIDTKLSGERLKSFRKENKFTQEKLASILNISRTTVTEYEKGVNIIATPFLYTICKKYNISADYLLGKIDEPMYIKKGD